MTVFTAIAFAAFFLEHDYFVALYKGFEHFAYNFSAFYYGSAYFNSAFCFREKNSVKL